MGRGEEAEKGEFRTFARGFFVVDCSLCEQTAESSARGDTGGV